MEYFWDIVQIVFADIILSGDNALVIGMAAAGLSPELRKKAIFWGMAMAAGLRIFFASSNTRMMRRPRGWKRMIMRRERPFGALW